MKPLRFILVVLVSGALGIALGHFFHRREIHARPPAKTHASATRPSTNSAKSNPSRVALVEADSNSIAAFEHELALSTGVVRWLLWMDQIERAGTNEFPRLARLAAGNAAVLRILATRWAERAPEQLFELIVRGRKETGFPADELSTTLLEVWSARDLKAVVAAVDVAPIFGSRDSLRMNVLSKLFSTDPESGLKMMKKWRIDSWTPRLDDFAKWAAKNPRYAAEIALENTLGSYTAREIARTIGSEWGKSDPVAALAFTLQKRGEFPQNLAAAALKSWATEDLSAASKWLAESPPGTRDRMSIPFVEAWAAKDPAAALIWAENNLNGSTLTKAAEGILRETAEKDTSTAARLVSAMKPSRARAAAAAGVAEKWFESTGSRESVPPGWPAWLRQLDQESVARAVERAWRSWSQADRKGVAEFLANEPNPQISAYIYSNLARDLAANDPVGTLQWANRLPEDSRLSAGSEAFNNWSRGQPEDARAWLRELPPEDPRKEKFFESMLRDLMFFDQAAFQRAAAAFTPEERTRAAAIVTKTYPPEQRAKFLALLKAG